MTDGYASYDEVVNTHRLAHLGCWADARRYLIEAEEAWDKRADHPVAGFVLRIGKLFAVEIHMREMEPEARQWARSIRDGLAEFRAH